MKHEFYLSYEDHSCHGEELDLGCNLCNLSVCKICGLAEASLTDDCPGHRVLSSAENRIMNGKFNYVESKGGWVESFSPSNRGIIKSYIFRIIKHTSDISRAELMIRFGMTKEDYRDLHAECLSHMHGRSL